MTRRSLPGPERLLFGGLLLLGLLLLLASDGLRRLDNVLYDSLLRLYPSSAPDDIAIIAIDEASLAELGHWPWPRATHARLLDQLQASQARALVFDVLFAEPDLRQPENDQALVDSLRRYRPVILPLHIDQRGPGAPFSEILPLPSLVEAASRLGHAHVELDEDGIARGLFLYQGVGTAHWPGLSLALLQELESALAKGYEPARAADGSPPGTSSPWLNQHHDFRRIRFAGPAGTITTYSYADVLNGRLPANSLQNKILFVGATAAGLGDFLPTPLSGLAAPMPGVEVHAAIFQGLRTGSLISPLATPWQIFISLLWVALPILLFPRLTPAQNLALILGLQGALVGASTLLLTQLSVWFAPAATMAVLLMAYPLWSWRRLASLNRFLNQELQRLSQEPTLQAADQPPRLENWYRQLLELLQPDRHALFLDDRLIRGSTPALAPRQDLPTGHWLDLGDEWRYRFRREQQWYQIALAWSAHTPNDEARHELLRNLVPPGQMQAAASARAPSEVIEHRIAQVQAAIAAMRSMRRFIGDSFEHMPDGILVTDSLGQVIFVNAHCRAWLPTGEDAGHPGFLLDWLRPFPPQGQASWSQVLQTVLLQGQTVSLNLSVGERDLLVQLAPFAASANASDSDSHDRGLIASFADITQVREEQRRRLEVVDFVSHDLRAPLVSQLALLEQWARERPDDPSEMIARARRYTEKSLDMADQFLRLSRVEAAEDISLYDCDLLAILENAVDQVQDQARERNIAVDIADDASEIWIQGNAELLERAALNLLTNAIKYSPDETRILGKVYEGSGGPVLEIVDQGQGIASDRVDQIFQRYRQAPDLERQRVTSAGLGLRFVKIAMERHQGQVKVDSVPGQGTSFRLCFPPGDSASAALPH